MHLAGGFFTNNTDNRIKNKNYNKLKVYDS